MSLRALEPGTGPDPADGPLLDQLVRLQVIADELDQALLVLQNNGEIGHVVPAGAARVAQIGAALALAPQDMVFGTQRDLPAALARGVSLQQIFLQAFGRHGDPGLGRGLPGAICDGPSGVSLSDGSVAAHLVHAAGFGHAAQHQNEDRVALAFFGGAAQQHSELHAALNFAAVYQARTIFVARGPLANEVPFREAGEAWGIQVLQAPADDGMAVYAAVREARKRAISGVGPVVIDARWPQGGGPAQPRDARSLQALDRVAPDRATIIAEVIRARVAADHAARVAEDTLLHAVYSTGLAANHPDRRHP